MLSGGRATGFGASRPGQAVGRVPAAALVALALLGVAACQSDPAGARPQPGEVAFANVKSLQRQLFPRGITPVADTVRAYPFVRAVEGFAEAYPGHDSLPDLLMRAAGVANGSGWSTKSIQLWGKVWRGFPRYPRAAEAMFYQGFVLDSKFHDYPLATQYYDKLVSSYPAHPLARQAEQLRLVSRAGGTLPPVPGPPVRDSTGATDSTSTRDSTAVGTRPPDSPSARANGGSPGS